MTHLATAARLGLAVKVQLSPRHSQYTGPIGFTLPAVGRVPEIAQEVQHDHAAEAARVGERQAGRRARLLLELARDAGVPGVVPAIVRARSDLVGDQCAILQDEELNAEPAHILQRLSYL